GSHRGRRAALHRIHPQARGGVTRGLGCAAVLLSLAAAAAAQVDTTARRDSTVRDSTARRDSAAADTLAHYLAVFPAQIPLDPARISLAPLERVDVVVLPASLRVYLVTLRQRSTATASQVGVASGEVSTANYRGAYLRRWRSGLGLSLVADYNNNGGVSGTSNTPFNSVDLWLKAEYLPNPHLGAQYQVLSSTWHRSGGTTTADWQSQRRDGIVRLFAASRDDGLGLLAQASFATASTSRDTAVPDRQ